MNADFNIAKKEIETERLILKTNINTKEPRVATILVDLNKPEIIGVWI